MTYGDVMSVGLITFMLTGVSWAESVRSIAILGKTYPIQERDFLEVIQERLKAKEASGDIKSLQDAMVRTAKHTVEHPLPIIGITTAKKASTTYYDPTIVAPTTLTDADGHILVAAGTRINPLAFMGLSKVLLFIDSNDPAQVQYADTVYRNSAKPVKVILVAGSYMALMRQWKRPVYYDQGGYLTQRFHITEVPAKVYQAKPTDTVLQIDVIPPVAAALGGAHAP